MLTDVLDPELEQGKLETVCHCFTLFKASFGIWLLDGGLSFSLFSFPCGFLVQAILGFPISWQLGSQGKSPRKKQHCRSPIIPQKSHSAPSPFPSSLRWPQDLLRFWGRNIQTQSFGGGMARFSNSKDCCSRQLSVAVTMLDRCNLSH